ncbi:MAG: TolC family protein [Cyanobacteria bacterium J06623_4]
MSQAATAAPEAPVADDHSSANHLSAGESVAEAQSNNEQAVTEVAAAESMSGLGAIAPSVEEAEALTDFSFPASAGRRLPQFSRLVNRLYAVDASATKASLVAADAVDVEVVDASAENQSAPIPERFVQTPESSALTLEDLRQWIAEDAQAEAAEEGLAIAQVEEDLPTLEEDEPTAEPEATPDPELDSEPAPEPDSEPELDVPEPATEDEPAAESTEINQLPDALFADPNPLSFPTSPEDVEVDRNPVVTLEQAIELAYQNNQVLQASLLSLEQANANLAQARAALKPSVSTDASLTNTQNDGSRTVLDGGVQLNYDLFTGGGRAASIRTAELQQEVSALTVETQQEVIRLAAANAYYDLQDAGEQIRINQSFLDEAARNLRDSQLRQEVGVGTRFDTLRAEVQFANARQALIQSQGDQRIARRDIARLLNLPPTTGLSTTPVAVAENWPLTLEDSILLAFQNRGELEQSLLQADISEQQRRLALSAIRPQVSLFARYSNQEILEGSTVFEDDSSNSVTFGAQFNMTLYDGGAARASARSQEIGGMISEEEFSESLDQIRFDVEQAFFNLQSNQENIATSEVAVAQAEEALELANLRLQAGVGTQLDVLTAQSELTQAEANNVSAILGYNRALVAIERAVSNISGPYLP